MTAELSTPSGRASERAAGAAAPWQARVDPFRVLDAEERRRHYARYLRILENRNGPQRFPHRELPRREAFFAALEREPVRWRGPLDREAFYDRFYRRRRSRLERRELWLHSAATSNEDETFAVDGEIERHVRRGTRDADPVELFVLLEEEYHRRFMREACRVLGVEIEMRRPRWYVRWPIYAMQHLPQRFRYVGILCGEVVGCILFTALRDCTRWFSEQPEVERRLWTLCNEILTDETLHVVYCRLRLGPVAIRFARWLVMPFMLCMMLLEVPALRALGVGPGELFRRAWSGLPVPPGLAWDGEPEGEPVASCGVEGVPHGAGELAGGKGLRQ